MPRLVLCFLLTLSCITAFSQKQVDRAKASTTVADARLKAIYNLYIPTGQDTSLYGGLDSVGALFYKIPDSTLWVRVGHNNQNHWKLVGSVSTAWDSLFNGNRPITRDFSTLAGTNLGTTTFTSTLAALLYPSQPPTAALTGGGTLEMMASGTQMPFVINWTAGRQAATAGLSSVIVAGVAQTFAQPPPSGAVSGTQSVLVSRNVNASFSNVVTTTDGKTATATVSFTFLPRRYWGFTSSASPADAAVQGLANEFVTARTKALLPAPVAPTGSQHFVIAFPASLDPTGVSTIWVNGLDQTGTFTRTVRAFTNASGYTQNYIFFITTNPTAGAIQFEIR